MSSAAYPAAYLGTLEVLLDGYNRMRSLAIKSASRAPEVVLEKVASSAPHRVSASCAVSAVDSLLKRGFIKTDERESMIRSLCSSSPDAVCAVIEKFAAMATPLELNFDSRLEARKGFSSVSTPSEYSSKSSQSWLEAANARNH